MAGFLHGVSCGAGVGVIEIPVLIFLIGVLVVRFFLIARVISMDCIDHVSGIGSRDCSPGHFRGTFSSKMSRFSTLVADIISVARLLLVSLLILVVPSRWGTIIVTPSIIWVKLIASLISKVLIVSIGIISPRGCHNVRLHVFKAGNKVFPVRLRARGWGFCASLNHRRGWLAGGGWPL